MTHEFFNQRIKKAIKQDLRPAPQASFSAGDFAPDLINKLKDHLRKIELAQLASVQAEVEVCRTRRSVGAPRGHVWDQIMAARRRSGK